MRKFNPNPLQRWHLLLAGIAALLTTTLAADDIASTGRPAHDMNLFMQWLAAVTSENAIPGGAVAIVTADGVSQMQAFGVRNVDTHEAVTSASIFRLASMSKTFAGTAAEILVDQHLLAWDTPLTELFPGMKLGTGNSSRSITFKQVASQSTGLMPHSYSNMLDAGVGYNKIKRKFNQIPTVCAPGTCYGYQNVVFSLIGDVVALETKGSYEEFLARQLFQPLGMSTASVGLAAYETSRNATTPHIQRRGVWRPTSTNAAYYTVAPASGVNASISDMAIWVQANLGGFPDVLSPAQLQHLHEPVIATPYGNYFNRWTGLEKAYYAIGWRVFDYKGIRAVHHGGGIRGYRSEMVFVPDMDVGMVFLMDAESTLANDVVPAFLDNLLEAE